MRTPPSPPGQPLVGDALRFGRDPFRVLDGLQAAYRDVVQLRAAVGPPLTVVLDPDLVHDVLADRRFRKPNLQPRLAEPFLGEGVLTSEGDLWRRQREVLQPSFFRRRIADYADVVTDCTTAVTDEWRDGDVRDVHAEATHVTAGVIAGALFSTSLSRADGALLHRAMVTVGEELELAPTDTLRPPWFPRRPSARYRETVTEVEAFVEAIVAERRADPDPPEDMLTALVRAVEDSALELADEELRDELVTFLFAGHETTALTLTYAWSLLSANPDARERLATEADAVCGDAPPTWDDLGDLEYTGHVVAETLRLRPPVWALFREPTVDARLGDYRVAAGSPTVLPQWSIHRDERYFETPEQFAPERWTERSPASTRAYFPFGAGPRACIGRQFALMEATLVLAGVAREWVVDVEAPPERFRPSITLQPRRPVTATLRRRE